jgi:hypothetical protein
MARRDAQSSNVARAMSTPVEDRLTSSDRRSPPADPSAPRQRVPPRRPAESEFPQCLHGVDSGCTACRDVARQHRHAEEHDVTRFFRAQTPQLNHSSNETRLEIINVRRHLTAFALTVTLALRYLGGLLLDH